MRWIDISDNGTSGDTKESVFRQQALAHRSGSSVEAVLPAYASPQSAVLAWIVIGLVLAAAVTVWTTEIPTYARGVAEVSRVEGETDESTPMIGVVDAVYQSCVKEGQSAYLKVEGSRMHVSMNVEHVSSGPVEAASMREQLRSAPHIEADRLLVVRLRPQSYELLREVLGNRLTYPIEIKIGERRIASMLPGVGSMLRSPGPCHSEMPTS